MGAKRRMMGKKQVWLLSTLLIVTLILVECQGKHHKHGIKTNAKKVGRHHKIELEEQGFGKTNSFEDEKEGDNNGAKDGLGTRFYDPESGNTLDADLDIDVDDLRGLEEQPTNKFRDAEQQHTQHQSKTHKHFS